VGKEVPSPSWVVVVLASQGLPSWEPSDPQLHPRRCQGPTPHQSNQSPGLLLCLWLWLFLEGQSHFQTELPLSVANDWAAQHYRPSISVESGLTSVPASDLALAPHNPEVWTAYC
jgi:hypothetical protein